MNDLGSVQRPEELLRLKGGRRLPVILQTEAAECGLACLAMISGYYGFDTDLTSLRRRYALSGHGLTLKNLMDIASRMQLASRALRVELSELKSLQAPCILHWDMNHFVVLKKIKRGKVTFHDPAVGLRVSAVQNLSKNFTGVALELTPTEEFRVGRDHRKLKIRQLWKRIVGLRRSLVSVLLLSLLLQGFAIVSPLFLQTVVDDVLLRSDFNLLVALALGFGLLIVIEAGVSALRQFVLLDLSSRLNIQMAANVFRHLIRLPLDYFQKRHLGDILSRFASLDSVREMLTTGLVMVVVDGIMAIIMLVVMFVYDARLTFIVLATLILYGGVRLVTYPLLRRLTEESVIAGAQTETSFMESVRAVQTIKIHQMENDRQNDWQNKLANTTNKNITVSKLNIGYGVADTLLFGIGNIVIISFATIAVMQSVMTLGMLYAFVSFQQRFVGAMQSLIDQSMQFRMISVHLNRLADIAFTEKEKRIESVYGMGLSTIDTSTQIETLNKKVLSTVELSFRYSTVEDPVFEHLSLNIRPGESVAIVGKSGVGKSTLLKCLMGLLQPTQGTVEWGGQSIANIPEYRRCIAGAMQEDRLLSGSIADNIACFDAQLDFNRVVACAEMAAIEDDIRSLPMKYDTLIGDMGSGLSGGQKQRVILARALYRNPLILFLDEATSHLDSDMERTIVENISGLNLTLVVVSHREETIAKAVRIVELTQ